MFFTVFSDDQIKPNPFTCQRNPTNPQWRFRLEGKHITLIFKGGHASICSMSVGSDSELLRTSG